MIHSSSGEYYEANKKGISSCAAGRKSEARRDVILMFA